MNVSAFPEALAWPNKRSHRDSSTDSGLSDRTRLDLTDLWRSVFDKGSAVHCPVGAAGCSPDEPGETNCAQQKTSNAMPSCLPRSLPEGDPPGRTTNIRVGPVQDGLPRNVESMVVASRDDSASAASLSIGGRSEVRRDSAAVLPVERRDSAIGAAFAQTGLEYPDEVVSVVVSDDGVCVVVRDRSLPEHSAIREAIASARMLAGSSRALRKLVLNGCILYERPKDPSDQASAYAGFIA